MKFNEMNRRFSGLEEELRLERGRSKALELECDVLRSELRREKARAEKLASIDFRNFPPSEQQENYKSDYDDFRCADFEYKASIVFILKSNLP
jgi:hypothetical protein